MEEKYNPEKHCCKKWWKDFCDCVKNGKHQKEYDVLAFLNENNIEYQKTQNQNFVTISHKDNNVFVSLKMERIFIKCSFNGKNWYTFTKEKFLQKFLKPTSNF
jgi:hypothetical protein